MKINVFIFKHELTFMLRALIILLNHEMYTKNLNNI